MTDSYITSRDGMWIAYERWGEGPVLVLVHGGFGDRSLWVRVLPLLAERFTVYAMDRRGHGASDPYPAEHDIEREYEDIAALIEHIGAPVSLLGHSSGARATLHAALGSPLVRRLVLYEPPLLPPPVSPAVVARLRDQLAAGDMETVVTTALLDVVAASENPGTSEKNRLQMLERLRESSMWRAALRNARSIPAEVESYFAYRLDPAQLRGFETPTVLLLGGRSGPVMRRWVEELSAALPVSTVMTIEGQGHAAMISAPELFVRTLLQALDWTPGT